MPAAGETDESPAGEATELGAASSRVSNLLSNPGVQSTKSTNAEASNAPIPTQEPSTEVIPRDDDLGTPLPERLQNLKISSDSLGIDEGDDEATAASEKASAAQNSKLQSLKGGLKGKRAVKQPKPQHKARKGYLIKG